MADSKVLMGWLRDTNSPFNIFEKETGIPADGINNFMTIQTSLRVLKMH